jgi:Ras GTPase-activating-like protein IQGAP2/3
VYGLLLIANFTHSAQTPQREDTLRTILMELEGVPNLGVDDGSNELHDARDRAITLELTNRFAVVRG